jgi:hypothetical protein
MEATLYLATQQEILVRIQLSAQLLRGVVAVVVAFIMRIRQIAEVLVVVAVHTQV